MKKTKTSVTTNVKEEKEKPEVVESETNADGVKKEHLAENAHMMEQRLLREVQQHMDDPRDFHKKKMAYMKALE